MRVSIAMCTYNGEKYLSEQLQSIAAQTIRPHQLVVCDDGSTDGTVQILEDFAKTAPFQVCIFRNAANLGSTKNFEKAIALCDGDLIALSDQDDIWYPGKLEVMCSLFEKNTSIGGVFSDGDFMGADSVTMKATLWERFCFGPREQQCFRNGDALKLLLQRDVVTGMTLVVRAELRDMFLPIPASWEHDGWIALILVLTSRLDFTTHRLVKYRIHEAQQIGVPESQIAKLTRFFRSGMSVVRARRIKEYARSMQKIDDLLPQITGARWNIDSRQLAMIRGKAEHSRVGLHILGVSRAKRIGAIFARVGCYRRYSLNWGRSMFKDLMS